MARIKIAYYVVKKGRGYWQPTRTMRAQGFQAIRCGPDGPSAWAKAEQFNLAWQRHRHGLEGPITQVWPIGSIGEGFARFKATNEWAKMKPRTREDWERGQRLIEPIFSDLRPTEITLEHLDSFNAAILEAKGVNEAYRAIKHWRRLWKKLVAMGYAPVNDPSSAIRRITPAPRSAAWTSQETAVLVKTAIRNGFHGLACIIAVAWHTQFSPVDVRLLRRSALSEWKGRLIFESITRQKTGRAIIGAPSRIIERLIRAYMADQAYTGDDILFRNRSARPYSKDTLGDDFRTVRAIAFPGDTRVLMDMRRSGAIEAAAGGADITALAMTMGNTIDRSGQLQKTYQPNHLALVMSVGDARKVGRKRILEAGKSKKLGID